MEVVRTTVAVGKCVLHGGEALADAEAAIGGAKISAIGIVTGDPPLAAGGGLITAGALTKFQKKSAPAALEACGVT